MPSLFVFSAKGGIFIFIYLNNKHFSCQLDLKDRVVDKSRFIEILGEVKPSVVTNFVTMVTIIGI